MLAGRLAQSKEAGNKEDNDDDADDVKNIHSAPIEACAASNEGAAALRGYVLEGIKFRFADLLANEDTGNRAVPDRGALLRLHHGLENSASTN